MVSHDPVYAEFDAIQEHNELEEYFAALEAWD